MKTSTTIKIHSFVDLITNSSSEVFVTATEKTVDTVKSLVNNILQAGGSLIKADDLFEFVTIVQGEDEETYDEVEYDLSTPEGKKYWKKHKNDEYSLALSVKVTAKSGNEHAQLAAQVLSALNDLFEVSERYN